jgi:hypothetical protein
VAEDSREQIRLRLHVGIETENRQANSFIEIVYLRLSE